MNTDTDGQDHEIVIGAGEREQGQLTAAHLRAGVLLLHTRGYVILRAVPLATAEALASGFREVYHECVAARQGEAWYQSAPRTGAIFWERRGRWRIFPKLRSPFDSPWLLANPLACQLLKALLGDDYFCKFVSSDTCTHEAILQSPHRELGIGRAWEAQGYIVNVPLGPCGLNNGPLEVWPGGSHLWRKELLERWHLDFDVQDGENPEAIAWASLFPSRKLVLGLGDLLIRDPGLLHRGTVNSTQEPRSMLTICYFRRGHEHDYGRMEYNLDRENWEQLDVGVRPLFPFVERTPVEPASGGTFQRLRRWWGRCRRA